MLIKFNKIKFKNFMSYGNSYTTWYYENGIDVVHAKNGAGKSASFTDTLFYGLYGKPYRKTKISTLINDLNKKELEVQLYFSIEDTEYKIVRGMKPSIFEIYRNGTIISQEASIKDYQLFLENNILKINSESFRQLIILGANVSSSKPFLELPQQDKEDVFNSIIDTSIFTHMLDVIKEKTLLNKTTRTDLEYKLDLLRTSYTSEKKNIDIIETNNDIFKNKHQERKRELELEQNTIEIQQRKIEDVIDRTKELKTKYDKLKDEEIELNKKHSTTLKLLAYLESELKQINKLKETHTACIGCEHLKTISSIDLNFEDEAIWKLDMAKGDCSSEEESLEQLNTEINAIQNNILKIKSFLTNKSNNENRLIQIEKELKDLEAYEFTELDKSNLIKLESDINTTRSTLSEAQESINNLDKLKQILSNKELKGAIIAKQLPILNKLINEYLEKFSSEFNMIIEPSFKEKIITSRGVEKEFLQLSNGQKFRLTFSLIFAFLKFIEEKNAVQTNILIADEVLDTSLDAIGRDDLLNILYNEFTSKNIIIISHNIDIVQKEELFSRTINIDKINNFSKIEIQK